MSQWCESDAAVRVVESEPRVFVRGVATSPTPIIEALERAAHTLHLLP